MLPTEPMTRTERYLARLAGQDVSIPDTPITREEEYLAYIIQHGGGVPAPNAGAHNSVFRGKNLGSTYTQAQADAIDAGTFDDLFVGDYWTIGNVDYVIAGFDIFKGIGNPRLMQHHAVVISKDMMGASVYNDDPDSLTGYKGSVLRTESLPPVETRIKEAFGADNVLPRGVLMLSQLNSSSKNPVMWEYVISSVNVMTEPQVYGMSVWGTFPQSGYNFGDQYSRFPLFSLAPDYVNIGVNYWLQGSRNGARYCAVGASGHPSEPSVDTQCGIRPYFCLGKAPTP